MLKVIIEKEIRDIIGSLKFVISFSVCAVLILLSFYVGATNYKISMEQYEAAKAENLRQMDGLTEWYSIQQHRVFLPPNPLASLVSGVSNDVGRTIEVNHRGELIAQDSKFNEEPIYAVFRFVDLSFIFGVVISLFSILLGYDAICGEKEHGTLRLSFANAVPRATYILGKLIGSFLTLTISLILAILIGCLLLPVLDISLAGDGWIRLLLIIGTGLLYFSVFLTLSVFISSLCRSSSSSFLMLLVIWVLSVLIIPRASVLLAGRAVDVPSVDELAAQKASFSRQTWKEFNTRLSGFETGPVDDIEQTMDIFHRFMDSLTVERDRKIDGLVDRLNETRRNKQMEREKIALSMAKISPSASLSLALANLAGTSLELKNRFTQTALDYRKVYNDFINEKTGMVVGGRMVMIRIGDEEEEPEQINPAELPEYTFNQIPLKEALSAAMVDIGILSLFNIIFFVGAFVSFLRYDVR
ncbi:MAG: ABC transporter permease [candidate division Zixibacteria bacterium]